MYPADFAAFLSGLIAMGYLVIGVFFLRFWRRTRDGLFLIFAIAFWLLALNYVAFSLSGQAARETGWTYLIRLAAFCLIIFTIVAKNISTSGANGSSDQRRAGAAADTPARPGDDR